MSILAVDIGGTFIKWAEADGYELKTSGKVPTPKNSFQEFWKLWMNWYQNIIRKGLPSVFPER